MRLRELLCRHRWEAWRRWPLSDTGEEVNVDIQRAVDVVVGGTVEERACLKCGKVDVRLVDLSG